MTELCYTNFLVSYSKATVVEGADDSLISLLNLLIEGIDSVPRIKKASVDMLKSVKARIVESAGKENGP